MIRLIEGKIGVDYIDGVSMGNAALNPVFQRLGNVLFWTGFIVGIVCAVFFGFVSIPLGPTGVIAFATLAFIVPAAIGWACRYVLAGR